MNFIVGCGRSATTFVARIINFSPKTIVNMENLPYLARESWLSNNNHPISFDKAVDSFLSGNNDRLNNLSNPFYFEKHVSLAPFLPEIYNKTSSKFIFVYRDGRDVVSSFLNWHNQLFGNIYRGLPPYNSSLSNEAFKSAANLYISSDANSLSLIPYQKNSSYTSPLRPATRFEAICRHWAVTNKQYLESFTSIPGKSIFFLNSSYITVDNLKQLFDFINCTPPENDKLVELSQTKVNSLESRNIKSYNPISWHSWDQTQREIFEYHSTDVMKELGYWHDQSTFWKPKTFGEFWQNKTDVNDWYKWMFEYRLTVNNRLIDFVKTNVSSISSIIDLGCGTGYGFSDAFKHINYTGYDLSSCAIDIANAHAKKNQRHHHKFYCHDFMSCPLTHKSDLVFSAGTIDNMYDIDYFLERMVQSSSKYIYITAFRGWFPMLKCHNYAFIKEQNCFNNDIACSAIEDKLISLGCRVISIQPVWTDHESIPVETEIVAHV